MAGRYNQVVELRLFIDPSTGQPHIYEHNVTEAEVEPDPAPGTVFVITAYDLGPKALKALRRRRKKS